MNDFLDRLAARVLARSAAVRPRLGSVYEPAPETPTLEMPAHEGPYPAIQRMERPAVWREEPMSDVIKHPSHAKGAIPACEESSHTSAPSQPRVSSFPNDFQNEPYLKTQQDHVAAIDEPYPPSTPKELERVSREDRGKTVSTIPQSHVVKAPAQQEAARRAADEESQSERTGADEALSPVIGAGKETPPVLLPQFKKEQQPTSRITRAATNIVRPMVIVHHRLDTPVSPSPKTEPRPIAAAPRVQVTIGRVEIRAVTTAATPQPVNGFESSHMSLDAYLKRSSEDLA